MTELIKHALGWDNHNSVRFPIWIVGRKTRLFTSNKRGSWNYQVWAQLAFGTFIRSLLCFRFLWRIEYQSLLNSTNNNSSCKWGASSACNEITYCGTKGSNSARQEIRFNTITRVQIRLYLIKDKVRGEWTRVGLPVT